MTAYARANDAALLGWHRHGAFWVEGIVPFDGCALCDAADQFWRRQEATRADTDPSLAAIRARRAALLGPPARHVLAVVPSLAQIQTVPRAAPATTVDPQAEIAFTHAPASVVPDNEVEEPPAPEPPPSPSPPTFVLTPPTAESIRRHRQRKPIR